MGVRSMVSLPGFRGLNEGSHRTRIQDAEASELVNFYPYAGELVRRDGIVRVSLAGDYFEDLTNAFAYKTGAGVWRLVVGGLTSLGWLDGDTLTQISAVDGSTIASSNKPWRFKQYKDVVYAAREGAGTFQRTNTNYRQSAGIAAPTTAATLADGGAGSLVAGDYIGVVTFVNKDTDAESNPSPDSNKLTLAASKQILWSGIPTSLNTQVNARRLYRTVAGGEGVYFQVGQINDNVTTTFTDNVDDDGLGGQVSVDNGLPPGSITEIEVWQERLWATDGKDVFFSEILLPESFSEFSVISVGPDDGHKVKGLLAFGDRLLVGKTNSTFAISSIDGLNFRLGLLSAEHGVFAGHTMRAIQGLAFWFGGDSFYTTDGSAVRAIGSIKVRKTIDSINPTDFDRMVAAVDESLSLYIVTAPSIGKVFVYNYQNDDWAIYQFQSVAPAFLTDFFDSNLQPTLYGNLTNNPRRIYQFFSGDTDDGQPIDARWTSKYFGFEIPSTLKIMPESDVEITPAAGTVDASLMIDEGTVGAGPVSFSINSTRPWFRVPLGGGQVPGTALALRLDYSGSPPIKIMSAQLAITNLKRRLVAANA